MRHRWMCASDPIYTSPKFWRCPNCGLRKVTEYECEPHYRGRDGRTWERYAPPCPPDAANNPTTVFEFPAPSGRATPGAKPGNGVKPS
jgi:hypothetical protein